MQSFLGVIKHSRIQRFSTFMIAVFAFLSVGTIFAFQNPTISLSTTNLSFSNQPINTTSTAQTVTVTNTGTLTVNIISITVATAAFPITHNCPFVLPVGSNCSIHVSFHPTQAGAATDMITISDTANGNPHTISLSGTGTQAMLTLSASNLDFFLQPPNGNPAFHTLVLNNSGNATLNISNIGITGQYNIVNNTCSSSLQAGGTCALKIDFIPNTNGSFAGTLTVTSNDPNSPSTVTLTGIGSPLNYTLTQIQAPGLTALSVGDMNGDGKPDIFYCGIAQGAPHAYSILNLGNGLFSTPLDSGYGVSLGCAGGTEYQDPMLVDVDGDGKTDIVLTGNNAGIRIQVCKSLVHGDM